MLFLTLLTLLPSCVAFDVPQTHRLDPAIPRLSPHENASSDSCIGQCSFQFIDDISARLGPQKAASLLNLNYNAFLRAFANTTFFEEFCTIYHNFQHCASKCETGLLHQMLSRSSEIVDVFCVFNFQDIKEKFPCLDTIAPSDQCLQTCAPHHQAISTLQSHFEHLAMNGETSNTEKYLGESCEYVICSLHCDVPEIAHHCDYDTANLVIDLTKKSFLSMEKMALDQGIVSKWPAVCSDLRSYALPIRTNPPEGVNVLAESPRIESQGSSSSSASPSATTSSPQSKNSVGVFFSPLVLIVILLF